jgi:hypothetical protein
MLFANPNALGGFLAPQDRQQAGLAALIAMGSGLAQGAAPSPTPGGVGRGLAQGMGAFGQTYNQGLQNALMQKMVGTQLAEAQRKAEFAKNWQAQFTPSPENVQMAMAGGGGPSMANAQKLGAATNPMLANIPPALHPIIADPEKGPGVLAQFAMREVQPPPVQEFYDEKGRPYKAQFNRQTMKWEPVGGSKTDTLSPEAEEQKRRIAAEGRTLLNVDARQIGNIPPGHRLVEKDGTLFMEKIPGSPQAEAARKVTEQQQQSGGIVVQDIDRALKVMDKSMLPATGMVGQMLSRIGGTAARDLRGLMDTIKANAGFKELQAMRDSSPTGGALGQVTIRELEMLQAVIGNLEQDQSREQLEDNLRRVKNVYLDIIHGEGNGPQREKLKFLEPSRKEEPAAAGANPYAKLSDQEVLDMLRKQGYLK